MKRTRTEPGFLVRNRYWILLGAVILLLPPLSLLPQLTKESNFCGAWCPRMFFVWREGSTISQFLLGFLRNYMGVALVLGILGTTLFLGRWWCSHLCPIGGTMEAGSRLVPSRLKIDFSRIPAPWFRYGYLAVYLVAPAIGIGALTCNYCQFGTIPRLFGAAFVPADLDYFLRVGGILNLALILALGVFARGGRAYCNVLCPVGAFDALANWAGGRFGRRVRVTGARCSGCGSCAKVCPNWAIEVGKTARVDPLSCTPCRLCEGACPEEAIRYGRAP